MFENGSAPCGWRAGTGRGVLCHADAAGSPTIAPEGFERQTRRLRHLFGLSHAQARALAPLVYGDGGADD
jgi:hypothetical protein